MSDRENFGSRAAVIMAFAGSAIGLGNIWRFPYMVGEYGGAAFILIYIVCSFVLSLPILFSESVIGRKTHLSTFGAMNALAPHSKWKWLGLLTVVTPLIILPTTAWWADGPLNISSNPPLSVSRLTRPRPSPGCSASSPLRSGDR